MHYKEDNATYTYLERTYMHVHVEQAVVQHAIAKMVVVRKSQVYKNLSQYLQQSCIYGASEKAALYHAECYSVSVQLSNRSSFLSFEHGSASENSQGIIHPIHCNCISGSDSLRPIDYDTVVTMEFVILSCQPMGFGFFYHWYAHVNHRFQQLPEAGFELFLHTSAETSLAESIS